MLWHRSGQSRGRERSALLMTGSRQVSHPVRTSVAVLVEACRGQARNTAVTRILNQGVDVLPVDRGTARVAARILNEANLGSCSAIDAIVVATAIRLGGALIVTSDPDDLSILAMGHPVVEIQPL